MRDAAFVSALGLPRVTQSRAPRCRSSVRMCMAARLADSASEPAMAIQVGTRVRVNSSIIMYHYPGDKMKGVDIKGFEGVVERDISMQDGVEMSATAPFVVNFFESHPKFRAHLSEHELDVLE